MGFQLRSLLVAVAGAAVNAAVSSIATRDLRKRNDYGKFNERLQARHCLFSPHLRSPLPGMFEGRNAEAIATNLVCVQHDSGNP
ncbi:MAG TPA: hypothetical protein DDZ51_03290 [Planctomycetaceae bacterium]|nr:hypothetical protein [Planctomycetaceae bacterium]